MKFNDHQTGISILIRDSERTSATVNRESQPVAAATGVPRTWGSDPGFCCDSSTYELDGGKTTYEYAEQNRITSLAAGQSNGHDQE